MKFPPSTEKNRQYEVCASIIGDTIGYMGYEVHVNTRDTWSRLMSSLASADTLSESEPSAFANGESLVACLEIEANSMAIRAGENLLAANIRSMQARDVETHLDSRREEATASSALLRSQAPEIVDEDELWQQIDNVAVTGIYLDSLRDAKEDAGQHCLISAQELAWHSAKRFFASIGDMAPNTRYAATRACLRHGLISYIIKGIPRNLRASDSAPTIVEKSVQASS